MCARVDGGQCMEGNVPSGGTVMWQDSTHDGIVKNSGVVAVESCCNLCRRTFMALADFFTSYPKKVIIVQITRHYWIDI